MNNSSSSFAFPSKFARRMPDPVHRGLERHILYVSAQDVPLGLPLDPNARTPNIRRMIYREVERSLLNEEGVPNTFHLKHKGITLVAESVRPQKDASINNSRKDGIDIYEVKLKKGHGILDGGHSYELLIKQREDEIPEGQYVKFEILTNVPDDWIPELSSGLNTSVQVQPYSIDNLSGLFDWIKDELRDKPYFDRLAWKEGEDGDYSIKDLIGIFTLFHIEYFPNDGDRHPVEGYEKKAKSLKRFEEDQKSKKSYQKLRPILHDILVLHDIIRRDGKDPYNDEGGSYGSLKFVEKRRRGSFSFPFISKTSEYRLMNGALYPILGAFRWMVEENPDTDVYCWRGGFEAVLQLWENSATELLRLTATTSRELGRNPDAIGKSRSHWSNLHSRLAKKELEARLAKRG